MIQTIIGIFENPDIAYSVEETLLDKGIDQSAFYLAVQEGTEDEASQSTQSMEDIRGFLSDLFGPESSEIEYYAREISRGGAMLSVDVPDEEDVDTIREVMLDAGAVDLNALSVEEEESETSASQEESQTVPVIEEEMEVGKREVGKGTVRVVSRTVETPVQEQVSLKEEHATIERRPVDKPVSPEELKAMGDKTIEVEEKAEKAVVSKSARVVEEVEIGKESSESTETIEDTVRHTEVEVERESAEDAKRKGGKKR